VRLKTLDVSTDNRREVEATYQVLERLQLPVHLPDYIRVTSPRRPNLMIDIANPALNDVREGPTLRFGPCCKVAHELCVKVARLPCRSVKPALQGDIRLGHDKLSFQRHHPGQIEKKALSSPVTPDDDPNARPALLNTLEVLQYRSHFVQAPNLDMAKAHAGNDSGAQ
jgi:hypothetical protein